MRFAITAGPTREPFDPVRFLSNRSSGKMGYALAEAALDAGHSVTLISGPVCLAPPNNSEFISVTTSDEMFDAAKAAARACDIFIMCAAVADFKPARAFAQKLPKPRVHFALELAPTRDILAELGRAPRAFFLVGFAAETHELATHARAKLARKNCDLLIANDVSKSDSGIESDVNEVFIFTRDGVEKKIPRAEKKIIAREIVKIISIAHEKSLTKKS